MFINKITLKKLLVVLLAVVFTTACNDGDKDNIEIMKIDRIFVDRVPEESEGDWYTYKVENGTEMKRVCARKKNYLLISSKNLKDDNISIKLYGCWDNDTRIGQNEFYKFESSVSNDKVEVTFFVKVHKNWDENGMQNVVALRREYSITNNFEVGDIEIVVNNPDGEVLTQSVTIE